MQADIEHLKEVNARVHVVKTNDSTLAVEPAKWLPIMDAADYLNANPRHALVIDGAETDVTGFGTLEPAMYVLRGASEKLDNFYFGRIDNESPNDSEGGDLVAIDAICAAIGEHVY
jgi:hypothetical protein